MNTGKDNLDAARFYSELYHRKFTTVQASAFDGQKVDTVYLDPWRTQVGIKGSDSFQNPRKHQTIYITDIYRGAPMEDTQVIEEINGVDTTILEVSQKFFSKSFPGNQPFFMDKYSGLLNLTSVKTLPLFISVPYNHLLEESSRLQPGRFLSESGEPLSYVRGRDTIQVHMEPYSGVCLKAAIYLQNQIMLTHEPGMLFAYSFLGDALLPVSLLRRVGGFSQESTTAQFGLMNTAFIIRLVLVILLALLCAVYSTLFIVTAVRLCQDKKYGQQAPDLSDHLIVHEKL